MKRNVAIYVSLFACILLLAHLFIPHHHHHGSAVCLLAYSSSDEASHEHEHECNCSHDDESECDCTHHPAHHDDIEPCLVKYLYFRADGNRANCSAHFDNIDYKHYFKALSNLCSQYEFARTLGHFFGHKPPLISNYFDLFLASRGLRAPPLF